ncbi:MAG TPA: FAD-binding and (Fe-S)-binding domain-containing protein [Segeticoccus sp.]|uniref:FAD-binding and (Fe-S)-binding domain-containing protein n=1 Tax=Segeticoccus sp. TaxID=2706531 RepID=UPI002D7E16EA|nr:FAD-binding and (Fe-S)-binding domain-containing protein [Segeticoccus sp.]HET8599388.1 FAD-binding and (Fe-S)-binding domain-containing protein [Segeticoccus sp.]
MEPRDSDASPGPAATERLARELASVLGAEQVSRRAVDRYGHAHDASHYLLVPHTLVTPRDTGDVAAVLQACSRLGVPLTFRSGGTSLSGQAVTDQVMVDTRRRFRGLEVLDEGRRVRVQPGVTVAAVNAQLARWGRRLGPDPASERACTIGGVVANNSSGMQCGTELNTYRTLESMVLVLPSGTVIDSGADDADRQLREREPELHDGLLRLRRRVLDNPDSVSRIRHQFSMKNTMGYGLNAFLDHEEPVDLLTHLLVGSEGTLGFVAEATFRTVEVLPHAATGLLVFQDLEIATAAVPQVLESGTATAELLDAASLRVSQQDPACPRVIRELEVRAHAALLVEFQGTTAEQRDERQHAAGPTLKELPLATPFALTTDPADRAALWHTRKGLYSAVAWARPSGANALLEDVVVPVDRLGATCTELTRLFQRHHYEDPVVFGHARDGNVHFLLNERFDDEALMRRYEEFTEDMVDLVLGEGGSLKAEHGTGRIMAPFVRRQYGDELYEVMWSLKRLVDPAGLLNPGSVLSDDPRSYLRDLKTADPVEEEVDRCVECGYCEPVCPSRDLTTTPRQRIVLRRELAAAARRGDTTLVRELAADYDYDAVQTCAVDGMCQTACPVRINTGDLVRRLRVEEVTTATDQLWRGAAFGWGAATRAGSWALDAAAALPAQVPVTATRLARTVAGSDHVPLYDARLPGGGRRRPRYEPREPQAVLFAACIGSMFGPEPGGEGVTAALVELCVRAGVPLRTPADLDALCCGTPWKSKGLAAGHDAMRRKVVPALRRATEDGRLPVVVDAGSCTQGLTELIAGAADGSGLSVVDATSFVVDRVLARLTVTRPWESIALHPTCSSTALGTTGAMETIARAVSDDVVVPTAWGCCGFAGDRGLLHPELTAAATGPEAAEVRTREFAAYASVNRTCEIGMTRATGRPYRHVLELLAEATR